MQFLGEIRNEKFDATSSPNFNCELARKAVRGVVLLDDSERMLLVHAKNRGRHMLVGGGIKKGENMPEALRREAREEGGCELQDLSEIGSIQEVYTSAPYFHVSYGFLARQTGELWLPKYNAKERANGYEPRVVSNINEAIGLLEKDKPKSSMERSARLRDHMFLCVARLMLRS